MKRKFFKEGFIGYLQKMLLLVLVAFIASLIISFRVDTSLKDILGYMGLGLIGLGGLTALGSHSASRDALYHQERVSRDWKYTQKSAMESIADSYQFTIFMLGAGAIVGLLSLLF